MQEQISGIRGSPVVKVNESGKKQMRTLNFRRSIPQVVVISESLVADPARQVIVGELSHALLCDWNTVETYP
jgi:hypothetical protein